MVHLFGDWFSDLVVIALVFVVYVSFSAFTKDKWSLMWMGLVCSAVVFVISLFEVWGPFFGESFIGPEGTFIYSVSIAVVSLGAIIWHLYEMFAKDLGWFK
jgi:hypothetical protein